MEDEIVETVPESAPETFAGSEHAQEEPPKEDPPPAQEDPPAEDPPHEEPKAQPEKSGYQKRIDQLVYEKKMAENQNQQLIDIMKAKGIVKEPEPEPEPETFDTIEEYTDYLVNKKLEERMGNYEKKAQAQQAQNISQQKVASFASKAEEFQSKHSDFYEKINDPSLPTSETIATSLIESDKGPEVAYYLANNTGELNDILKLSPYKQAIAIGRLEAKVESGGAKVRTSNAPAPLSTVGGGSSMKEGPSDKDDVKTWMAKETARLKKLGKIPK